MEALKEYDLPPHKLFHPSDLWEEKGFVFVFLIHFFFLFDIERLSFSPVNVVECLMELSKVATSKGFGIGFPQVKAEGEFSDDKIRQSLSPQEIKVLKTMLSKVKEAPSVKKRPKISEAIVRKKLALLAGNGVDCKIIYLFCFNYILFSTFSSDIL